MSVKASELPSEVKKHLLGKVKEQLGDSEYRQMVDVVGEDTLLDMVLAKSSEGESTTSKVSDPKDTAAFWVAAILAFMILVGMGIGGYKDSGWGGLLGNVFIGFWIAYGGGFGLLYAAVRYVHFTAAIGVGGVLLVGALYVLWKALTFTAGGTVSWFRWLFGHF